MIRRTFYSFGMILMALVLNAQGQTITRGPYLQQSTMHEVTVCWRSDVAVTSQVFYGSSPTNLTQSVVGGSAELNHELTVTNLLEDTRYYYQVAGQSGIFSNQYFKTHPSTSYSEATRIWAIGDFGTGDVYAEGVKDSYLTSRGNHETDVWLLLGDVAYPNGTDAQYQTGIFDIYSELLPNTVMWPTRGNHERDPGVYYSVFDLPTNGEAGGVNSGSEAYYSFNYGDIHFVCLDSYETPRGTDDAMLQWLQSDLGSATQEWIIAFFHHPPYSKGSHNSDSLVDSAGRLVDMRVNALPILEAAGVDLVLSGHSHSYERSKYIEDHYGFSESFEPGPMLVDDGDGASAGDGAYVAGNRSATVYTVMGSSGAKLNSVGQHPVMHAALAQRGSVLLEVEQERLRGYFLDINGNTNDVFEIWHGHAGRPQIQLIGAPVLDGIAETARLFAGLTDTGAAPTSVSLYWGTSDEGPVEAAWDHTLPLGLQPRETKIVGVASNLPSEQTFYYRFKASNASGAVWTAQSGSFTTPPTIPILDVDTNEVFSSSPTTVSIIAEIISTGGSPTSVWVSYGEVGSSSSTVIPLSIVEPGPRTVYISGLNPGTQYYYRLFGNNSFGSAWSLHDGLFSTLSLEPIVAQRLGKVPALIRHALIDSGSRWYCWDHGSLPANDWLSTNYNSADWSVAPAPLEYGGEIENTALAAGPDPSNIYTSSYFLKPFYNALDPADLLLWGEVQCDDEVRLYLNGHVIFASNLPQVGGGSAAVASSESNSSNALTRIMFIAPSTELLLGRNVLAAEVQHGSLNPSAKIFDLQLESEALPRSTPWGASHVTFNQATVLGDLLFDGTVSTDVRVYFGTSDGGTNELAWPFISAPVTTPEGAFGIALTNLSPHSEYFVRLQASNSYGVAWANLGATFATPEGPDGDMLDDAWEALYFGDGSFSSGTSGEDFDLDGLSDADEQIAGTSPVDPLSSLALYMEPAWDPVGLSWDVVPGRVYRLEFSPDLMPSNWVLVETNLTSGVITNLYRPDPRGYYRIGIKGGINP